MGQRTAVISIRVSEAEKAKIEVRAKAKGLTITAHTREIITGFDADEVAIKAKAVIDEQDAVLSSMADSIGRLNQEVRAISKQVRDDRVVWVAITAATVFLLSLGGGVLAYWFAGMVGL